MKQLRKRLKAYIMTLVMIISVLGPVKVSDAADSGRVKSDTAYGLTVTQKSDGDAGIRVQGTVATGQHYLFSIEKGGTYEVTGTYGSEASIDTAVTQDEAYGSYPDVFYERGIIEVNTSEPVTIILNDATIYTRYSYSTPIVVNDKGFDSTDVTIEIKGNNKLANLGASTTLTTSAILKQDGDRSGKLTFTGDGTLELKSAGPCIGAPLARTIPAKDYNCTNITFSHTGTINATSTNSYTVIGANDSPGNGTNRYVSNIFVNSGTLNLTTGTDGVGGAIGTTGNDAYCGGIYINGGRINVNSEASKDDHYILGSLKNYNIIGVYGGLLTANNDIACMNYTKAGIYPVQIDDSLSSISDIELEVSGNTYDLSASKQITSEGKLKFYLPKGIAKVKVNGTVYWGTITGSLDTLTLSKLDSFVPVTNISGIPSEISAGKTYTLSGTVNPSSAVDKTISYEIVDAGTTGATLNKNVLNTTDSGTIKIRATIKYGSTDMTPYTQDFTITAKYVPVTDIDGTVPVNAEALDTVTLPTKVKPADATKQSVVWSIDSENNTANATLVGNKLSFEKEGSVKLKATVQNGKSTTEDYEKTYEISVTHNKVTDISIDKTSIDQGADAVITATTLPATGKYSSIEWEVLASDNSAGGVVRSHDGNSVTVGSTNSGSFKLKAKVKGYGDIVDYEETFVINVTSQMTYDLKKGPITIVKKDDTHNTITYYTVAGTQASAVVSKDEQIVITTSEMILRDEDCPITIGTGSDSTEAHIALKNISMEYYDKHHMDFVGSLMRIKDNSKAYVSAIGDNKVIARETVDNAAGSAIYVECDGYLVLEENAENGKLLFTVGNNGIDGFGPFIGGLNCGTIDITGGQWEFKTKYTVDSPLIGTYNTEEANFKSINISGGTILIDSPGSYVAYIGFSDRGAASNSTINFTGGRIETTRNDSTSGGAIFGAGRSLNGTLNINISGGTIYSRYANTPIIGRTEVANSYGTVNINISGGEIIYKGGSVDRAQPVIGCGTLYGDTLSNVNIKISGGIIDVTTGPHSFNDIGEPQAKDTVVSKIDISGGTIKASVCGDVVKISGGTITGDVVGTPKNTSGNDVFKTEVNLSGALGANAKLKETDNTITQSSNYTYGFKDVYTDSNGKLYIYLPAASSEVATTAKLFSSSSSLKVNLDGSVKQDGTGVLAPTNQYTVTVTQANIAYGETLPDPEYTVKDGGADVTIDASKLAITYTGTSGTSYSESATKPTAWGSYIVKVAYADDAGCGSSQTTFTIDKKSISSLAINGLDDVQYTGAPVEADLEIWNGGTKLTKGIDYTVAYANNTAFGAADVTITGKGNYKDTVTKHFNIVNFISSVTVADIADQYYTGGAIEPVVTVTDGTTLSLGVDYTVSYDNNYETGTATVIITGMGNYSGSITKNFVIKYVDAPTGYISGTAGDNGWYTDTVIISKDDWMVSLDAENWKSYIVIDTEGTTNKTIYFKNSDEQITDGVNVAIKIDLSHDFTGQPYVDDGDGVHHSHTCKLCGYVEQRKHDFVLEDGSCDTSKSECSLCHVKNIAYAGIEVTVTNPVYTGTSVMPAITVKNLIKDVDYTVTGDAQTDVKSDGTYSLIITGIGLYAGKITVNWNVEKVTATIATAPTAKTGLIYDETAQALVEGGTSSTGTVKYSTTENGTYTTSIPTGTNTGSYSVWYKVEGSGNYKDSEPVEISVTIAPKDISGATIILGDSLTYSGETQTQAISSIKVDDLTVDCTVSNNTGKNAGTYTLTVTGKGNFTGTATKEFNIANATLVPNTPGTSRIEAIRAGKKVSDITLPTGWVWADTDKNTVLPTTADATETVTAIYTASDADNYVEAAKSVSIVITMSACTHPADKVHEVVDTEPTCTETGVMHKVCNECGLDIEINIPIAALGHSYSAPVISWSDDFTTATGNFDCTRDGCTHTKDVAAVVTNTTKDGVTTYVAKIILDSNTYFATKHVIATEDETTRIVYETGVKDIPTSLVEKGLDTEEKIIEKMYRTVTEKIEGFTATQSEVVDVAFQMSTDGGSTWTTVTPDNFPSEGLVVTIPYPEGTNADDYDFVVTHMVTVSLNGLNPGDVEMPAVTKTAKGIQFTVKSLSPIGVSWKALEGSTDPKDPTNPSNPTDPSNEDVETGEVDNRVWLIALLVSLGTFTSLVLSKRKRKEA